MPPEIIASMESLIESSLKTLEEEVNFDEISNKAFRNSCGIIILNIVKTSFMCAAQVGAGILLRHDPQTSEWSPPLAIGLTGLGAGFGLGVTKKSMVIFVNKEQMERAIAVTNFSVRLGAQTAWAFGSKGEGNDFYVNSTGKKNAYGYSSAKGVYTGATLDGVVLAPRPIINKRFYGESLTPKQVILGNNSNKMKQITSDCEPLTRLYAKLEEFERLASSSEKSSSPSNETRAASMLMKL